MKNQEVAEIFALKGNHENTKGNNMFINENAIYSYGHHFKIAEKVGFNMALFNF
jgi:hypothetical protein